MSTSRTIRHAVAVPAVLGVLVTALTVSVPSASAASAEAAAPTLDLTTVLPVTIGKRAVLSPRQTMPLASYRLTGRFGDVSGLWSRAHTGLDFATGSGTPIRSVDDGVVVSSGYDGAYGNKTVVRHADGTEFWYCHQSGTTVATGQRVAAGQVIGYVGSTGNVTGPHLHLEVRPGGGDPVDPLTALRALGLRI